MNTATSLRYRRAEKDFNLSAWCWKHKITENPVTTDGEEIDILDPGLHNSNQGADFFSAKVKIDGKLKVGSVMTLVRSSLWYATGCHRDSSLDNVVLVITTCHDTEIENSKGETVPQMTAAVPEGVRNSYQRLLSDTGADACKAHTTENVSRLTMHAWMAALQTEWLSNRCKELKNKADSSSWDMCLASEISAERTLSATQRKELMKNMLAAESLPELRENVSSFLSSTDTKNIRKRVEQTIIETVCPWLFAYGEDTGKENLCDRAFDFIEQSEYIASDTPRRWKNAGFPTSSGGDRMAIEWLEKEYCSKKKCLRCRLGYEFMKQKKMKTVTEKRPIQLSILF